MLQNDVDWVEDWMKAVGGTGFTFFLLADFNNAIKAWKLDIKAIHLREKQNQEKYHKGMWYFNIGLCYENLNDRKRAQGWYKSAFKEDCRTYKNRAREHMAFKKLEEYKRIEKKSN